MLDVVFSAVSLIGAIISKNQIYCMLSPIICDFLWMGIFICSLVFRKPLLQTMAEEVATFPDKIKNTQIYRKTWVLLTLYWCAYYLILAVFSIILLETVSASSYFSITTLCSNVLLVLLIVFTYWFARHYWIKGQTMDNNVMCLALSLTNCYLIKAGEGFLLIDNGFNYDEELFINGLRKLSVGFEEINYVFLTHHHNDHSGLTSYIIARDPAARVIMHESAAGALANGMNESLLKCGTERGGVLTIRTLLGITLRRLFHHEWTLTFPSYANRDTDILIKKDDDLLLKQIGIGGRILYTPGHTADSISILLDNGSFSRATPQ